MLSMDEAEISLLRVPKLLFGSLADCFTKLSFALVCLRNPIWPFVLLPIPFSCTSTEEA